MNRWVVDGLIREARLGKRIALFGRLSSEEWQILALAAEEDGAQVLMAVGRWSCSYPHSGGGIKHFRNTTSMRGFTSDLIVVLHRDRLPNREERECFHASTSSSTCPEVMYL